MLKKIYTYILKKYLWSWIHQLMKVILNKNIVEPFYSTNSIWFSRISNFVSPRNNNNGHNNNNKQTITRQNFYTQRMQAWWGQHEHCLASAQNPDERRMCWSLYDKSAKTTDKHTQNLKKGKKARAGKFSQPRQGFTFYFDMWQQFGFRQEECWIAVGGGV